MFDPESRRAKMAPADAYTRIGQAVCRSAKIGSFVECVDDLAERMIVGGTRVPYTVKSRPQRPHISS
ncbi:hypothetical protein [Paenibacillus piri]|uniref:Uncharacterized protein n=1 Tax=Paenibacillus piri TaxID=2547395 RepID=A0A4R5KGI4_9BACL|nr:hypothetical protein [Paenibacillus piri]TDF94463.1 hypothetical protein E1757_23945 [Paenibacillus piri]